MIRSRGPFVQSVHLIISTVRVFYGGLREFYFICGGMGELNLIIICASPNSSPHFKSSHNDLMHIVSHVTDFLIGYVHDCPKKAV